MVNAGDGMLDVLKRMRDRSETPEFKAAVEALEAENAEKRAIREAMDRKLYLATSGIPRQCRELLDTPGDTEAMQATRRFLADSKCLFLTLAGPTGRGKTSAAAWACFQRRGLFTDASELVSAGLFDSIWDDAVRTPLLVIDELGAEHTNEAAQSSLMSALIKREGNLLKTIIITNQDGNGFGTRYLSGPMERLGERLKARGIWISLPGPSLRRPWNETDKDEGDAP